LGLSDGIRKTPESAEPITGVPAVAIRRIAMEFATVKPAAMHCAAFNPRLGPAAQAGIAARDADIAGDRRERRGSGPFCHSHPPATRISCSQRRRFGSANDMHVPWSGVGHYALFMRQAIESVGSARNDLEICADLVRRLDIDGYHDKTEEAWLRELCAYQYRRLRRVP
jgi:anaerobic selenocysteine-containing dehydrogenase